MAQAQPRLVLVDDTDPSIQYSGPWFKAQDTDVGITGTNFEEDGPPFENTLHGVNVNASFSYSFSGMFSQLELALIFMDLGGAGSSVTVMGTIMVTNASATQDPSWECSVDNFAISVTSQAVFQFPRNNIIFCQDLQLNDEPHVLTVTVISVSNQTFWFDQIQYLPSASVSLSQVTLRIDSTDPALQYSSGWTETNFASVELSNTTDSVVSNPFNVKMTNTTGATITFVFSGQW